MFGGDFNDFTFKAPRPAGGQRYVAGANGGAAQLLAADLFPL